MTLSKRAGRRARTAVRGSRTFVDGLVGGFDGVGFCWDF